jgi:hypothetical protein
MKKIVFILKQLMFLAAIPLIIGAFAFADHVHRNTVLEGINVQIANPAVSFLTQKDIEEIVRQQHIIPGQTNLKDIKLKFIEKHLESHRWTEYANLYVGADNMLHIYLVQKEPIVRIVFKDRPAEGCYLDKYANPVELSENFYIKLPVVTMPTIDYTKDNLDFLHDVVKLSTFIQQDIFWNAALHKLILIKKI